MSDRLSATQILLLASYAVAMAGGQMLFKVAAMRAAEATAWSERISAILWNGYFVAALFLYGALTILWVWILTAVPISRAYPFVALAFALTPVLGILFFNEPASYRLAVGIVLILCGLYFIAG
jgi:multidrug transporter EmrE-like cation transporter